MKARIDHLGDWEIEIFDDDNKPKILEIIKHLKELSKEITKQ